MEKPRIVKRLEPVRGAVLYHLSPLRLADPQPEWILVERWYDADDPRIAVQRQMQAAE